MTQSEHCVICSDDVPIALGGVSCKQGHFHCDACFLQSLETMCESGGQFSSEVNNTKGDVSLAGQLPCSLFIGGECCDGDIPLRPIRRRLLEHPDDRYDNMLTNAMSRIAVDAAIREKAKVESDDELAKAHDMVMDALAEGHGTRCPGCSRLYYHDGGCHRMECPRCSTTFCYWCGKSISGFRWCSRDCLVSVTDDENSAAIFQIWKIKKGVLQARESIIKKNPATWEELKKKHPDLLKNALPNGHSIDWDPESMMCWFIRITKGGKRIADAILGFLLLLLMFLLLLQHYIMFTAEPRIMDISITHDRMLAIVASNVTEVKVWDLETKQCIHTLRGPQSPIATVTITENGKWVGSGDHGHTAHVWDLDTGTHLNVFEGHTGCVRAVAISEDGQWVVTGSDDNTVRVWDRTTGETIHRLEGHTDGVLAVAISSDAKWVASGGKDWKVFLWNRETGHRFNSFVRHVDWVRTVAISPDGKWVASGSDDRDLEVWNRATGQHVRTFRGLWRWNTVKFSHDGTYVIAGSRGARDPIERWFMSARVRVWEHQTGNLVNEFFSSPSGVSAVAISPGTRWLVAGAGDTVHIWDRLTGVAVKNVSLLNE